MSKLRKLEPFIVPVIAGAMAILGGYLASREAFRHERGLRDDQRAADTRAAARVLDLELFNRVRVALSAFGMALPPGDIKNESVLAEWDCVIQHLDMKLANEGTISTDCGGRRDYRRVDSPDPGTRLTRIPWPIEDRRLLASRVRGDRWFRITVAVDSWGTLADSHASVRELVKHVEQRRRTARAVVETVRALTTARAALAPYVVLEPR